MKIKINSGFILILSLVIIIQIFFLCLKRIQVSLGNSIILENFCFYRVTFLSSIYFLKYLDLYQLIGTQQYSSGIYLDDGLVQQKIRGYVVNTLTSLKRTYYCKVWYQIKINVYGLHHLSDLYELIILVLENSTAVKVRTLAKVSGKIIAMSSALGFATHVMTSFILFSFEFKR